MSSESHLIRTFPGNDCSVKTQLIWRINNFLDRPEKHPECIQSPHFVVESQGCESTKWCLQLHPKGGRHAAGGNYVSVYVINLIKIPVKISYKVSILDSKFNKKKETVPFPKKVTLKKEPFLSGIGVHNWLRRRSLKNDAASLLPGGHLMVYFELTVYNKPIEVSPALKENVDFCSKVKSFQQVGESFGQLLDNKDLIDTTIRCGGKEFPCHKLILSARSPVFKAMFQANMKESETKDIEIEDIEPEVVAEMLHFIYTGGTNEMALEKIGEELLSAADKYELETLKEICEDKLCSGLTVSNAIRYLILGDMYQAQKLRHDALRMVADNMATIVRTEAYQKLKEYPDILIDIPKAMIK